MKKAEMSMSMIVGAVIAIVILVILIFLIARSTGDTKDSTACPSKGGVCVDLTEKSCSKTLEDSDGDRITCADSNEVCCSITAVGSK